MNRRPLYNLPDALRPETARSPVAETRQYVDAVRPQAQPRVDLRFNPQSLSALMVPKDELNFVADTMRYGDFVHLSFTVGQAGLDSPILTRPQNKRIVLIIQNTHGSLPLFVGFGVQPSATNGLRVGAGQNAFFDAVVPQSDVYLLGGGANVTGLITYCNQEFGRG